MFYVYHHINKETGEIFYVGKGKGNRAYSSKSRSSFWHNLVNKYGYDIVIVENNLSEETAYEREIYWIKKIGRKDLNEGTLVNFTDGGDGVLGYTFTESDKLKMSIAHSGESNHFYGKIHTEESKQKMSDARKGKPSNMKGKNLSQETKDYLRYINLGKTHTEETKQKMSISRKGKPIKGHEQTEETRKKISESSSGEKNKKRKEVVQLDMNGNVIKEWRSVADIKRELGIWHVDSCCRGLRNHAGGFKWIYKQIINN